MSHNIINTVVFFLLFAQFLIFPLAIYNILYLWLLPMAWLVMFVLCWWDTN